MPLAVAVLAVLERFLPPPPPPREVVEVEVEWEGEDAAAPEPVGEAEGAASVAAVAVAVAVARQVFPPFPMLARSPAAQCILDTRSRSAPMGVRAFHRAALEVWGLGE